MASLTARSLMNAQTKVSQGTRALVVALQEGRITPLNVQGRFDDEDAVLAYALSDGTYPGRLSPGPRKGTYRLMVDGEAESSMGEGSETYAVFTLDAASVDAVLAAN